MSGRRRRNGGGQRNIQGPNSALTEFLREKGISAADIRRRQEALRAQQTGGEGSSSSNQAGPSSGDDAPQAAPEEQVPTESQPPPVEAGPSKSKKKAAAKKKRKRDDDDDDEDYNDNVGGFRMSDKNVPAPGAIAFCEDCDSRFTVTAYSRKVESGGLLCAPCGRKTQSKQKDTKKKTPAVRKKAKKQDMNLALDGTQLGSKSLQQYCIERIAGAIDRYDGLGPLHHSQMDQICRIICRNRSLTPQTIKLFLVPDQDKLAFYDCSKIDVHSLKQIAMMVPGLKDLTLHHAGSAVDELLDYYAEKLPQLESFHLKGAFLVSQKSYVNFLSTVGPRLKSLTLSNTARTNKLVIEAIANFCPNLKHLNISCLQRFDDECLRLLAKCQKLKSLDISFAGEELTDNTLVEVLNVIGSGLENLNISGNPLLTSVTLDAIHACCANLRVLNLNELEALTDADIANLFTNWTKNAGLQELHLSRITLLTDEGLMAAVNHSHKTLKIIDVNSCNMVTKGGLLSVLNVCKRLEKFDVAFIREVDDEVVEEMINAGLTNNMNVWGCTRVTQCAGVGKPVRIVGREVDIHSVDE